MLMTVTWYCSYTRDKMKIIKDSVVVMKIVYPTTPVEYMHHKIWLIHGRI